MLSVSTPNVPAISRVFSPNWNNAANRSSLAVRQGCFALRSEKNAGYTVTNNFLNNPSLPPAKLSNYLIQQ